MSPRDAILLRRRLFLQAALAGSVACDKAHDGPPPCLSPIAPPCPPGRGLIAFADTSVTLGEPQRAELRAYAQQALSMPSRIWILVHISALPLSGATLDEGEAARLNQSRAEAVRAELAAVGLSADRLDTSAPPAVVQPAAWSAPIPNTPGAGWVQLSCSM